MTSRRRPNERLRALMAEARLTGQELAGLVNRAGAEAGFRMHYDRTSVSHWLAGTHPRSPVPELLAEVISRALNRPVSLAEAGLRVAGPTAGDHLAGPDPLAELSALWQARVRRAGVPYSLSALNVPSWPPLVPAQPRTAHDAPPPTAMEVVETAESLARVFSDCDRTLGGGSVRRALGGYLSHDLVPRMRDPGSPAVGRRLHAVGGRLAYLCGFMCFDDELHGLAQRHYRVALSLAAEIDDQAGYAITLREMSVQARLLGHHDEAVRLAEAAVITGKAVDPVRRAFLHGQLAVALAAVGDRARAMTSLAASERFLERATSTSAPLTGAYHLASLAHQEAAVRNLLGDTQRAASALALSIRYRPDSERRARAITLARLAELQLGHGHLDEAVSTWHKFLGDYPYLSSGRADTALAAMRALLRPHTRHAGVTALLRRAASNRQER